LTENQKSNRRRFLERLITGLGIAGITGFLGLRDVPKASAYPYVDLGGYNTSGHLTTLECTGKADTLRLVSTADGSALVLDNSAASLRPTLKIRNEASGADAVHVESQGVGLWMLCNKRALYAYSSGEEAIYAYGAKGTGIHVVGAQTALRAVVEPNGHALDTSGRSRFGGDIFPLTDDSYNCGDSVHRWKNVYADEVHANRVVANSVVTRSMSKFKENIESPTDINYLSAVPDPKYFNWKDSNDQKRYLGYIADQLPRIARDDEGNVHMNSVIAILCGAVQQLKAENEQLRRIIQGKDS